MNQIIQVKDFTKNMEILRPLITFPLKLKKAVSLPS